MVIKKIKKEWGDEWDKYFDYFETFVGDVAYPERVAKAKYKKYKIDNQHTLKDVKRKIFIYKLKWFIFFSILFVLCLFFWYNISL